ncbi:MAG: hypothetical protein V1736_13745, partial [Pseudomonadota bacterium]
AERIRVLFENHCFLSREGLALRLSICIGVAACPEHARGREKLIELAEVLDTTVDYLLTGNQAGERPLHNIRLLERFRALENLQADDQETVIKLIDAIIVKNKVEVAIKPFENRATDS